jgi:glycosyltransferase involved in cell wall biosynthesis
MGKDKQKLPKYPFVSVCMPTFNRRPFIPIIIECFINQTYPKDKIEWIIVDDGTDKIEDLVKDIPQVKYFKFENKMTLGAKRNFSNNKAIGDIIVYMDDDDYYPPERISHAVDTLKKNPKALCAGSSEMYIYFKHIHKMYKFGPYGPNHATAATFAFRKELLKITKFEENACVAEERKFLKDYTIPFVQLDSNKSILVFSHDQNSFDKKELLKQMPNPLINETTLTPSDFVKEPKVLKFFMEDINTILSSYDPGKTEHKQDVLNQIEKLRVDRENMAKEQMKKEYEYNETMTKIHLLSNPQLLQQKFNEVHTEYKQILDKNAFLKTKINTLKCEIIFENKIEYIKPPIDLNSNIMYKLITEYNYYTIELKKQNNELENQIKIIIAEKIQEKMQQKIATSAEPTLTLKDDST